MSYHLHTFCCKGSCKFPIDLPYHSGNLHTIDTQQNHQSFKREHWSLKRKIHQSFKQERLLLRRRIHSMIPTATTTASFHCICSRSVGDIEHRVWNLCMLARMFSYTLKYQSLQRNSEQHSHRKVCRGCPISDRRSCLQTI